MCVARRMSAPPDEPSSADATPSTILVVEPDILVRMVIADYLRDCGYKVLEGATADDVVTVLGSGKQIDVVFAEVQLSGSMNGFGLVRWVREKHPAIDVILTSGVDQSAEKAGDLCDEGPLEKPYDPQEVRRRISRLLERRRPAPLRVIRSGRGTKGRGSG
jgi:DNA-binding response OmpR family regulator